MRFWKGDLKYGQLEIHMQCRDEDASGRESRQQRKVDIRRYCSITVDMVFCFLMIATYLQVV